jgi:RNA-directed DNA polymerase
LHVTGTSLKLSSTSLSKTPQELAAQFALLTTFEDVAAILEITPFQLYHFTHGGQRYTNLVIKKKHGGMRFVRAPIVGLKIIQKKLNQVLQAVYQPKSVAHGFIENRSVVSNAATHCRARFVLNVDLAKFFETITFFRVLGMFMAKPYSRNKTVAATLARICCSENVLPQGSPCSPVVSNMLVARMDSQLKMLARTQKCTYTRYVDDLSFSTFVNKFPKALAHFAEEENGGALQIGASLLEVIHSNGFAVNAQKSRLQHSSGRQVVTGITTNRFPNVPQEFVRQIRAMLHAWDKFGGDDAAAHFFQKFDYKERSPEGTDPADLFKKIVKGRIDYLGMVRGRESRTHLSLLEKFASLQPNFVWPPTLPPREVKLDVLERAVFAIEGLESQGTAFNLRNVGIITCAHVVAGKGPYCVQRYGQTDEFSVTVVHIDEDRDLALLKFDGELPNPLPQFELASVAAEKEDQIVLMGYPNKGVAVSSSIERGAISGHYVRFGQARHLITCTIYQGNSGGPLLDRNYRLVGIAANGISKEEEKPAQLHGVIPISVLADFLNSVPDLSKSYTS